MLLPELHQSTTHAPLPVVTITSHLITGMMIRLPSVQGWLGRSDTELGKGEGVSAVRWWGNLIAWASSKAVQVGCTGARPVW
jgi:hypothetical protein